jgi:hypothetical protein
MSTFTANANTAASASVTTSGYPRENTSIRAVAPDASAVVVSCAWCARVLTALGWRHANLTGAETHGICPSCFADAAPGVPYPGPT